MALSLDVEIEIRARERSGAVRVRASSASRWDEILGSLGVSCAGCDLSLDGLAMAPQDQLDRRDLRRGALLVVRPVASGDHSASGEHSGSGEGGEARWGLCVLSGPRAGETVALHRRVAVLGREDFAHATVAARHLALRVRRPGRAGSGEVVEVCDLGSANRTLLDGCALEPGVWTPVDTDGDAGVLCCGAVLARLVRLSGSDCSGWPAGPGGPGLWGRPDRNGAVAWNPAPRIVAAAEVVGPISLPAVGGVAAPRGLRASAIVLPLLFAVVMIRLTGRIEFALFAALSPLTMMIGTVEDRRRYRLQSRGTRLRLAAEMESLRSSLQRARSAQRRARFEAAPSAAEACARIAGADARIWERQASHTDVGVVVVGYALQRWAPPVKERTDHDRAESGRTERGDGSEVAGLLAQASVLGDVPVVARVVKGAVIGIAGPSEAVRALARSVVVGLAVQCAPSTLRLAVEGSQEWGWARWLPHLAPSSGTAQQPPAIDVAVVDALANDEPVRHDPRPGASTIVLRSRAALLPADCTVVVELRDRDLVTLRATVNDLSAGTSLDDLLPAGLSAARAGEAARTLARLREATPGGVGEIPDRVALGDLLGSLGAEQVATRWARLADPTSLGVLLGSDRCGATIVDLVRDGPHALVAGTTGSGKSELLRTWIAALGSRYRPEDLNFVLVDFKGGAAFAALAELPHVVGVVTDLDGHLAARALRCLDAEVIRREQLLRSAGAADLVALRRSGGILARLVVVIDEFATLASDAPGFLDALVSIAQRGRSLGIHLILATQRPSGAVSENIRANTNIRLCLRVQSGAESVDVIGTPEAAALPRAIPGRVLLRLGPGEIHAFQAGSAAVGERGRSEESASWIDDPPDAGVAASAHDASADPLVSMVAAAVSAARALDVSRPHRPWPDPLPSLVDLERLLAGAGAQSEGGRAVQIGVLDDPDAQRWRALRWEQTVGPLLVVGARGSGVTSTLAACVVACTRVTSPVELHVHVIDFGAELCGQIVGLPHAGDLLGPQDSERLRRLLSRLDAELMLRRERLGAVPGSAEAAVLLVVDDYASLRAELETPDRQHLLESLHRLVRDGAAVSMHVVVGTDRFASIPPALQVAFAQRLLLSAQDRFELAVAGASGIDPPPARPGRGIALPSRLEAQVALPVSLAETMAALAARWRGVPAGARVSPVLPVSLTRSELMARAALHGDDEDDAQARVCFVGLGDREVEPVGVRLGPGDGVVVCGPPRSGRSATLALLRDEAVRVDPQRATVEANGRSAVAAELVADVEALLALHDRVLLVVDDAELLDDPTRGLERLVHRRPPGLWTLVAGRADALRGYGHWTTSLRRSRTGVLLRPNLETDGDVFQTVLPRRLGPFPPGRVLLLREGELEVVQVAHG